MNTVLEDPPSFVPPPTKAEPDASGLLGKLAAALGISQAKLNKVLGDAVPKVNKYLNATCPSCHRKYRTYDPDNYPEDQSVCPACRDESMAAMREQAQKPERDAAKRRLAEEEAKLQAQKESEKTELVTLVAQTVAQVLAQSEKKK